ncbi:C6 zinc finger domain-containing protein [Drepanopeziza brunnea f. sp. 'multigermtubi' MB_m1]|uniref:C6 zinc finger domain-containing protein n=1 Tax=Marssonina brunnea f. sp. multigermtubi (strain MB_m1) TaxID=1072389 RepID=K1WKP0_MARBU|nr:C6 zinc finger domain-containing protein [Drepanopeziza brunnea f. sp. 'multigermtubi' MB_m1]EKD18225.1 C6 zinc finger domain-containing protein [Drepanopeziza brunnea f. sp. 'multigermtubi' MB_m1]
MAPKSCFGSAIIIPFWFTGQKCRDPTIRLRVISLLRTYPRREGVWDSVFAGLVIDCLRRIEEENMKNGYIPGWARISSPNFGIDAEKRTVELRRLQRISATSWDVTTRRHTFFCYIHTSVALEQLGPAIAQWETIL